MSAYTRYESEEEDVQEIWAESFDASDDESAFDGELSYQQNLGSESPFSDNYGAASPRTTMPTLPVPVNDTAPTRRPIWRSRSFDRKKRALAANAGIYSPRNRATTTRSPLVEQDCGICFTTARNPAHTACCGGTFCYEHIADWLSAFPQSTGACPTCSQTCSLPSQVRRVAASTRVSRVTTPSLSIPATPPVAPTPPLARPVPARYMGLFTPEYSPPSYSDAPDYDSSDSESDSDEYDEQSSWSPSSDDSHTAALEAIARTPKQSSTSSSAADDLFGKVFTLMALTLALCLLFNRRASQAAVTTEA